MAADPVHGLLIPSKVWPRFRDEAIGSQHPSPQLEWTSNPTPEPHFHGQNEAGLVIHPADWGSRSVCRAWFLLIVLPERLFFIFSGPFIINVQKSPL